MQILENVDLSAHSTMRLGGKAAFFAKISNKTELEEAVSWAEQNKQKIIMIGDGSNVIWKDEGFAGLVLENCIAGYELQEIDENNAMLTVGAGENWDQVVAMTVESGYFTLAPLSLIPGKVGATPIQNVGAYGQEVSNCILTIEAYDSNDQKTVIIRGSDCSFGYRTSRFKTTDKNRFFITAVTFSVSKLNTLKPYYDAINTYATEHKIQIESPETLRQAVIDIRSSKLPDPREIANNGSFFANPIISAYDQTLLLDKFPLAKYWHLDDGRVKVSAAWLLETAGFKDYFDEETGMATWPKQSLVLVNKKAKTTADLEKFKQKIVAKVQEMFNISLEQEPELLP